LPPPPRPQDHPKPAVRIASLTLRLLQMLAFTVDEHAPLPWLRNTIAPARELTHAPAWLFFEWIHRPLASSIVPFYFVGFFASLAWVVVFAALQTWAIAAFSRNSIGAMWPLRLLRVVANISASVAFIPLLQFLMSVFVCVPTVRGLARERERARPVSLAHATCARLLAIDVRLAQGYPTFWSKAGYTCFAGAHLGLTIVAAVLAVTLVALCALFTLIFFDSHPLTSDLAGKAHGRVEFAMLLLRSLLVVMVQTAGPYIGPWPVIATLVVAGAVWMALYLAYLPFTSHAVNQAQIAVATLFTFASLCLVAGQASPTFDAAIALYLGAPLAAIVGVTFANWRRQRVAATPVLRLASPYEVEMHARFKAQDAIADVFAESEAAGNDGGGGSEDEERGGATTGRTGRTGKSAIKRAVRRGGGAGAGSDDDDARSRHVLTRRGATSRGSVAGGLAGPGGRKGPAWRIAYNQMDVEARARTVRSLLPPTFLAALEQLYRDAVFIFPASAMLQVSARAHNAARCGIMGAVLVA